MSPLSDTLKRREEDEAARNAAAIMIQRVWRARTNRAKRDYLNPEKRWNDTLVNAQFVTHREAAADGENDPKTRWRRALFMVKQLNNRDDVVFGRRPDESVKESSPEEEKHLEAQHWLELIDGKHRYGSNLKWYHQRWVEDSHTKENFFNWLDHGEGKGLSLEQCSREQLEKERILVLNSLILIHRHVGSRYLSAEQRLNYLVKISDDGKLLWAKNNQPVDTTAGDWKDIPEGGGIVPQDMPDVATHDQQPSATGGITRTSSEVQQNSATHYAGGKTGKEGGPGWKRTLRRFTTLNGMVERLLRKTVRRNTWIYVSDNHFNIYIGIKETGTFQHSSFTSGGTVTSAGLISVKQGVIHTLSPLSGHYRTSVDHFHRLLTALDEKGVDLHRVRVEKAEFMLWGIEHLAKFKKKEGKVKDAAKKLPEKNSRHKENENT